MVEALAVKTGATYAVTYLVVGAARHQSFEVSESSRHGPVYSRRFLSICDISFRTPVSDIRAGMCGTMTHGDEAWRVRVTDVTPMTDSLEVRGLALVSDRVEWLNSPPTTEVSGRMLEIERQFYD